MEQNPEETIDIKFHFIEMDPLPSPSIVDDDVDHRHMDKAIKSEFPMEVDDEISVQIENIEASTQTQMNAELSHQIAPKSGNPAVQKNGINFFVYFVLYIWLS